jgi:predicted transcriptional regulator
MRSRFETVKDILSTCRKKTRFYRIMQRCNLSYTSAVKYLQLLERKKLLVKTGNGYLVTDEGRRCLDKLNAFLVVWNGIPIFSEIVLDPTTHPYISSKVKR